jgi:hypothetical protein
MSGMERGEWPTPEAIGETSEVSHIELFRRISDEILSAGTETRLEALSVVQEAWRLPQDTEEEILRKLQHMAQVMKAITFSAFDTVMPTRQPRPLRQQLRFGDHFSHQTWELNQLLDGSNEKTDRTFVAEAHGWFNSALYATKESRTLYSSRYADWLLTSYAAGSKHASMRAIAEAGVSHAGTLAMAGDQYSAQASAVAHDALMAAKQHSETTGEEVLSAGEKYVLSSLFSRHNIASLIIQNDAWRELQELKTTRPAEVRKFIAMRNFLYDKSGDIPSSR